MNYEQNPKKKNHRTMYCSRMAEYSSSPTVSRISINLMEYEKRRQGLRKSNEKVEEDEIEVREGEEEVGRERERERHTRVPRRRFAVRAER